MATGAKKYRLPGQVKELSASEFQDVLMKHEHTLPPIAMSNATPKIAGTGDFEGVFVYKCVGAYRGDDYCVKCPLRKKCITMR